MLITWKPVKAARNFRAIGKTQLRYGYTTPYVPINNRQCNGLHSCPNKPANCAQNAHDCAFLGKIKRTPEFDLAGVTNLRTSCSHPRIYLNTKIRGSKNCIFLRHADHTAINWHQNQPTTAHESLKKSPYPVAQANSRLRALDLSALDSARAKQ